MNYHDELQFDAARTARLRAAYNQAVEQEQDTFQLDGVTLLTSYANYLVEFLESELAKENKS